VVVRSVAASLRGDVVFRFEGDRIGGRLVSALVTIVLRAPQANLEAQVARFDGTHWVPLPTDHGGLPDLFSANITEIGDYAVLLTGPAPTSSAQESDGAAGGTPLPSAGPGTLNGGDGPNWVVIAFVVAAIGVGLAWGALGGAVPR